MSKLLTEPKTGYVKPKDDASSGIYPKTLVDAVYNEEKGESLSETLKNLESKGSGGGGNSNTDKLHVRFRNPQNKHQPSFIVQNGSIACCSLWKGFSFLNGSALIVDLETNKQILGYSIVPIAGINTSGSVSIADRSLMINLAPQPVISLIENPQSWEDIDKQAGAGHSRIYISFANNTDASESTEPEVDYGIYQYVLSARVLGEEGEEDVNTLIVVSVARSGRM